MSRGRIVLLVLAGVLTLGALGLGLWALLYLGSVGREPAGDAAGGNGGFITTTSLAAGQVEVLLHPLGGDGSIAAPLLVYRGPGEERSGPLPIDGVGGSVLLGWTQDGPSTQLQVRAAGDAGLVQEWAAPGWCSVYSDGPDMLACLLLDGERLLRTTTIAPGTGLAASVMVDALDSGEQLARFGPFPGLEAVLGTVSSSTVLLVQAEGGGGRVSSLDLTTGTTTLIGTYGSGWVPVCALSADAALGVQAGGTDLSLQAVGASVLAVTWTRDSGWQAVGCSADGRFAYLQATSTDTSQLTGVVLDRVRLSDGARERILDSDLPQPQEWTR